MNVQWPGKWFVGESQLDYLEFGFDGTVWAEPEPEHPDQELCLIAEHIKDERDARLIAAAPDLLVACQRALSFILSVGVLDGLQEIHRQNVMKTVDGAIRKAEGGDAS